MITKYGMSETLGNLFFGDKNDEVFLGKGYAQTRNFSEEMASKIDVEVKDIIDDSYSRVKALLTENMDKLHAVANSLLERERLEGFEFEKIFNGESLEKEVKEEKAEEKAAEPKEEEKEVEKVVEPKAEINESKDEA